MTTKKFIAPLVVFSFALSLAGCGDKGPAVQFVEGTVSFDGNLIDNCSVTFSPKDKSDSSTGVNRPLLSSGLTDAKGHFRLSAVMGGAIGGGTTVGEYAVCIVKKEPVPQRNLNQRPGEGTPEPEYRYITPRIFEEEGTTPITLKVEKGKNRFDFDLKADGSFTVNGQ